MFAKLQKHKERKSKQQLKFRFDVYDIECIHLPQNVFSCRVLLTRGAKVSLTSESYVDANTNSASFLSNSEETEENTNNNKLTQIVTLYREQTGQFEPKAYNVKLQACGNSTTFARGILDASKFCADTSALSEHGFETTHEMRMDNGVTHVRCKVRMTWLKNWTKGGASRRSEMDMTELSFISSANLSASFMANNDTSGMENDNDTNPFTMMTTTTNENEKMVPPSPSAANGDEQDLSGFDEELGEETTTITTTPVSSSASPLRKFNTSEVKRSLSTTSYLSPIGECSTPELANNRADTIIANGVTNEEAVAREKALAEQQRQTTIVVESLRKEAKDLRRKNDELTRDRVELETRHEEETEKLKSKIDAMRDELRVKEEGQKDIEKSAFESSRALETQTRKLERLEADFAQAKMESSGLKEQTQSLEAALVALRNKQEEKKANDENIASLETSNSIIATTMSTKHAEEIAAFKSTLEKKEKQIVQLEHVVKKSAEEISREREKTDAMIHRIESERDLERTACETELAKCETEIESLKSQLVSVVQETTMLATDLRKDLQKRADKEIRDANEEAMKAREELDRCQKELEDTNVALHSHVSALVNAKTESAVAQGEVLELRLALRKTKEKFLDSLARLTRYETKDVMRRASLASAPFPPPPAPTPTQ
jgi:colicin import membrane protein